MKFVIDFPKIVVEDKDIPAVKKNVEAVLSDAGFDGVKILGIAAIREEGEGKV